MTEQLYNTTILRLASAIPHEGRLAEADASATRVSAICGSRVSAHVVLGTDGRVARFGQEVRACALGQAAAAIVGARVVGLDAVALDEARDGLERYLAGADVVPWPELEIFAPAKPYRARHPSILLALEAAADATGAASATKAEHATLV